MFFGIAMCSPVVFCVSLPLSLSIFLSLLPSLSLSISLSSTFTLPVYLSFFLSISRFINPSFKSHICLSICHSIYLSIYLYLYLYIYIYPSVRARHTCNCEVVEKILLSNRFFICGAVVLRDACVCKPKAKYNSLRVATYLQA